MQPLKTNYATPYALVRWGGQVPGQRARTKLAFLRQAVVKDGQIVSFRARVRLGDRWAKTDYIVFPADVIQKWRNWPSDQALRLAKQKCVPPPERSNHANIESPSL